MTTLRPGAAGPVFKEPYVRSDLMLDATLSAAGTAEGLDVALTVRNDGDEPVTLRFRTGQRADFAAYDLDELDRDPGDIDDIDPDDEAIVWRHGAGRMFTQVLGSETLTSGDAVTYESTWQNPPGGTYGIVGSLSAQEHDATATTTVALD